MKVADTIDIRPYVSKNGSLNGRKSYELWFDDVTLYVPANTGFFLMTMNPPEREFEIYFFDVWLNPTTGEVVNKTSAEPPDRGQDWRSESMDMRLSFPSFATELGDEKFRHRCNEDPEDILGEYCVIESIYKDGVQVQMQYDMPVTASPDAIWQGIEKLLATFEAPSTHLAPQD